MTKQQAQEELDNASTHYSAARGVDDKKEEIHSHRVLGGDKATMNVLAQFCLRIDQNMILHTFRTPN